MLLVLLICILINIIMAANGISTLTTKQARQKAKLDLAQLKCRGYSLNADGSIAGGPDVTKMFYRARNHYDITLLPTQYVGNTAVKNTEEENLEIGRPWINLPLPINNIILEDGDQLTLETGFDDFVTQ